MTIDLLKNAENFKIEDAKPENVEMLRTIVRDAWLELYPNETYGITREDIAAIDWYKPSGLERRRREIMQSNDIHTWVVRNNKDEVVGFCKAFKFDGYGEVNGMYVVKEFQGKGLGKKLMQQAFEWIGSNVDVRLKVVSYNSHAIEFYKRMEFIETSDKILNGETELPNGKEVPRIEMLKKASN